MARIVRCNWCFWEGSETSLIPGEKEFCPHCGKSGYLMDMYETDDEEAEESKMPSLGCFMVAYKWMYGGTMENARMMYDEYIRQGGKQAMFAIIDGYKQNAARAWAND